VAEIELIFGQNHRGQYTMTIGQTQESVTPKLLAQSCAPQSLADYSWFTWGTEAFDEVLPSRLRQKWDQQVLDALARSERLLVKIRKVGTSTEFMWLWEGLIGQVSRSEGFSEWYSVGRFPGPIDLVRSITGHDPIHSNHRDDSDWRISVVKAESSGITIVQAADLLDTLLRDRSGRVCCLEPRSVIVFNGANEEQVQQKIAHERAQVVEIIAHGNTNDLGSILVNGKWVPWTGLIKRIGQLSTIKIVILTWCGSDLVRPGEAAAAAKLCDAGVPAVLTWHPKPQLYSVAAFHRGFYSALLDGADVARAATLGRSAIFNSLNHDDRDKWVDVYGPRLYVRSDASVADIRLPQRRSIFPH
jgi:hypothetical protein